MKYSKSRVKTAASNLRNSRETRDDIQVINDWRSDYGYILKKFSGIILRQIKKQKKEKNIIKEPILGQRFKRFDTIKDKIQKRHSKMCITRMNDIAGCRLIFEDEKELYSFKENFATGCHSLIGVDDKIKEPEPTGYRGVHNIYKYHSKSDNYKGKRIEVQFRTKYQHYWATAVEIYDIINGQRIKFSTGIKPTDSELYFQYSSEIIARSFENTRSCFPDISNKELIKKFREIDSRLNITTQLLNIEIMDSLKSKMEKERGVGLYNMVIRVSTKHKKIHVYSSEKERNVLSQYFEWENKYPEDIPVYILGLNKKHIEECFKNYFYDSKGFTTAIIDGLVNLKEQEGESNLMNYNILRRIKVFLNI